MADKKITALSALASTAVDPAADLLHIIDYSASPVNKKITVANLFDQVNTNTSIYGNSLIFEVGQAAAVNSHIRVAVGANATTDGAVTVNDDGVAYVDFIVKSLGSDQALVVDAGADTVTVNGDSIAALDFVVKGDTTTLIHADGGLDAVGLGTASPDTAYTVTVAATGTNGIKSLGSVDITGALSTTTNGTIGGAAAGVLFLPSVESVTYASGSANHPSVAVTTTLLTMTTGSSTGVLPNGTSVGQIKIITAIAVSGSGTYTNTPATMNGFSTFAIDAAGDAIMLQWQTAGWTVLSFGSCVLG
jgi:hypothetical protein